MPAAGPSRPSAPARLARAAIAAWFDQRGWTPFPFQKQVWKAMAEGRSGMLHATTGAGKTYAVWLGALAAFADVGMPEKIVPKTARAQAGRAQGAIEMKASAAQAAPLTVLWLTPMRALAADTLGALRAPLEVLAASHPALARWTTGARTGDTAGAERSAQSRRLPTVLVTTPESLSLLLARTDAREVLGTVQLVVADEWHELLGSKRGVQVQLALARLAGWSPTLRVWGMSATLGNLEEAMDTLLGHPGGTMVQGKLDKRLVVDALLPDHTERFSWAGHLGLRMLPQVVQALEETTTALVFVNVRSQAELWYKAILDARPDWAGTLAIHHGSLDRGVREWVEAGLKAGTLRAVVCTSSLDLGVDFLPVQRVLQIGSPKGVARLLQRAGRSGHAPGRPSRITLVPTHSLEMVEAAAARAAVQAGEVETRTTPRHPVDVLVQHLVTVALGGGFTPDALYAEVCGTAAYRGLPPAVWQWCLDFVRRGGESLQAYPDYRRVEPDADGIWRVPDARLARRHRANIGTIVSDASMAVQVVHGARLGTMEESFLARLSPGDCFVFAGQVLELVKIADMTAWVQRAPPKRPTVPRWGGTRMPLSTVLADCVLRQLALAEAGHYTSPELKAVRPLLDVQRRWSALPTPGTLLAETLQTREGWHLFVYPFAGRHAHLGLASLFAWRASQGTPGTFSLAVNDYGLELLSATEIDWAALLPSLLRTGPADAMEATEGTDAPGTAEGTAVPASPDATDAAGVAGAGPAVPGQPASGQAAQRQASTDPAGPGQSNRILVTPETTPALPLLDPATALGIRNTANAAAAAAADAAGHGAETAAAELAASDADRRALLHEVLASLNATELARRRFREIARIAGLIFQSHPGEQRSARQLQASAQLFFEVFRKYDGSNLLLRQADAEVLSQELDVAQLLASLRRMQGQQLVAKALARPSPFAFPLMVERFREKLTNENLADRIARMLQQLETAADAPADGKEARSGGRAGPRTPAGKGKVKDASSAPIAPAAPLASLADPPSAGTAGDEATPQRRRRRGVRDPEGPDAVFAPRPEDPALVEAAQEVRRMLDFSLTTPADAPPSGKTRRQRKPSRPLPLL